MCNKLLGGCSILLINDINFEAGGRAELGDLSEAANTSNNAALRQVKDTLDEENKSIEKNLSV